MRGADQQQSHVFSYLSPEERVRKDHPLRAIRAMVDEVLKLLSRRFDAMYARVGRPSIPPEQLLRAQLLQMLYSIRSERLLMEEMDYNLLFRWFVGLNADDEVWDATTFTYLNGVTSNYSYDPLYELTQVTQGASTTESYSYDAVGNRLSSLGVPNYNYNASNELTSNSAGSYQYDANGNTLSDPSGKSYSWEP